MSGTQQGNENSRMYNEMVLLKLVQSMTKMVLNPPEPFRREIDRAAPARARRRAVPPPRGARGAVARRGGAVTPLAPLAALAARLPARARLARVLPHAALLARRLPRRAAPQRHTRAALHLIAAALNNSTLPPPCRPHSTHTSASVDPSYRLYRSRFPFTLFNTYSSKCRLRSTGRRRSPRCPFTV